MTNSLFSSIALVPASVLRAHFEQQYAAVTGNVLPDFMSNSEVLSAFGEAAEQHRVSSCETGTAAMVAEYNTLTGKNIKKFSSRAAGEKKLANAREMAKIVAEAKALETSKQQEVGITGASQVLADETSKESGERSLLEDLIAKKHTALALGLGKAYDKLVNSFTLLGFGSAKASAITSLANKFTDKGATNIAELLVEAASMAKAPKPAKDKKVQTKKVSNSARSSAIANSWRDPATAAARAERTHVSVNGVVYRSVRAAFVELGLRLTKHIKFRGELKAAGILRFEQNGVVYVFNTVSAS